MKFRIISSLILLVVLALAYFVFESNQPDQGQQQAPDPGLVLH
jgi:hypothetical protein